MLIEFLGQSFFPPHKLLLQCLKSFPCDHFPGYQNVNNYALIKKVGPAPRVKTALIWMFLQFFNWDKGSKLWGALTLHKGLTPLHRHSRSVSRVPLLLKGEVKCIVGEACIYHSDKHVLSCLQLLIALNTFSESPCVLREWPLTLQYCCHTFWHSILPLGEHSV